MDEKNSKILIRDIVLMNSEFIRSENSISSENENSLNIELKIENEGEKLFGVKVLLNFESVNNEKENIFTSKIIMKGIFELEGDTPPFIYEFYYVNAPAIIYPYIREHLNSLTVKAGLPPVNIPPFNFVAFGKDYIEKLKENIKES